MADRAGSRKAVVDFGLPAFLGPPVALLLPLFELACVAALIPASLAWWGAAGLLAMLVAFTAAISVNLALGRRPDCHCFGQLHSGGIGWKTLVRNGALLSLAAFVMWQGPRQADANALAWLGGLDRFEAAVLCFAALAAAQVWFSVHVLRQNGRLMLRMEALEGKLGSSAEAPPAGLVVNSAAPAFSLQALDGGSVTLEMLREKAKPILLVFGEPACSLCNALLPDVAQWQREYADRLLIVPISRGTAEENRAKIAKLELRSMLLQKDRETAQAYLVTGSPTAVLLREGLIASSLAEGADAIRSLVGRATLPPPVKKGDPVPSLKLADLTGKTMDLATVRGSRTLLLFWSPACGFCQQMLAEVKDWERHRAPGAPDLLVISGGSFESNQQQGFRSRVLLDPNFGAGEVFGAGGTPSAVLLDEDGRVASEVSVGAQEVFVLAGKISAGNGGIRPVSR